MFDYMDFINLLPFLIVLGAISGFFAGLLGIGGGIILVPGLYYSMTYLGVLPDVAMPLAVGTSLAIIIPTGFSSARAHYKKGAVDGALVKRMGAGILIGVLIGTMIADHVSGQTLKTIFAFALLFIAGVMGLRPARFRIADHVPGQPWLFFAGSFIGTLSTLMGVGGASMSVPFMSMCGVAMHRAVGTASALGVVISIPAAIGFMLIGQGAQGLPPFSFGYVNLAAAAVIIPIAVLVAPFGARAAHKLSVDRLRYIFAGFLVLVAFKMLTDLYA